jgi:integrase/recombinase XerD
MFLIDCGCRNLRPNTTGFYRNRLKRLAQYLAGINPELDSDGVTVEHLRGFITHESERGLSTKTINHTIQAIKTFYSFLYEEGLVSKNPAVRLRKLVQEQKKVPPLPHQDIQRLFDSFDVKTLKGARNRLLLLMIYDTGARITELLGIKANDVDFRDGSITIRGKGQKDRYIYLCPSTQLELRKYLRKWLKVDDRSAKYLFVSEDGLPLTRTSAGRILREAGRDLGIDGVGPHRIRHSFTDGYHDRGGDSIDLQRELGHSSLDMVYYYLSLGKHGMPKKHALYSPANDIRVPGGRRRKRNVS